MEQYKIQIDIYVFSKDIQHVKAEKLKISLTSTERVIWIEVESKLVWYVVVRGNFGTETQGGEHFVTGNRE